MTVEKCSLWVELPGEMIKTAFINGTKYIIDEITIRGLSMINDDMIIGLRFL
jgi:hypothetical protein